MKIRYVIDSLDYISGGTERQLYFLLQGMVRRGHDVKLYLLRETSFTQNLKQFPCTIHCLGINSLASIGALKKLWQFRKELRKCKIDVVHGFFTDVALLLPPVMMLSGIKTFTSRRDMGIWYSAVRLFILRLFRFTKTQVFCNSISVAKLTEKKEWKPRNAIHIIYNGIEPIFSLTSHVDTSWAPDKASDWDGVINVILVANIRRIKRIEDLIKAASGLQHMKTRPHFYIVGKNEDDAYYKLLQKLLRDYDLCEDFHFVGAVEDPRSALDRFDIGVLTSESEGLSNSIMEYMAAGLPVVASRVGGNGEVVSDGYSGFLYDAGDVDQLAACLGRLAGDPDLRRNFGKNSKISIRRFDITNMVELHESLYMAE